MGTFAVLMSKCWDCRDAFLALRNSIQSLIDGSQLNPGLWWQRGSFSNRLSRHLVGSAHQKVHFWIFRNYRVEQKVNPVWIPHNCKAWLTALTPQGHISFPNLLGRNVTEPWPWWKHATLGHISMTSFNSLSIWLVWIFSEVIKWTQQLARFLLSHKHYRPESQLVFIQGKHPCFCAILSNACQI